MLGQGTEGIIIYLLCLSCVGTTSGLPTLVGVVLGGRRKGSGDRKTFSMAGKKRKKKHGAVAEAPVLLGLALVGPLGQGRGVRTEETIITPVDKHIYQAWRCHTLPPWIITASFYCSLMKQSAPVL